MANNEVKSILEYKNFNDMDYVYVGWVDGTFSWEKIENLNCKGLICNFFKDALEIIKRNERMNEEKLRKQKEENLLQKMINRNINESVKSTKQQNDILNTLVNKAAPNTNNSLLKGFKKVNPATSDFIPELNTQNMHPSTYYKDVLLKKHQIDQNQGIYSSSNQGIYSSSNQSIYSSSSQSIYSPNNNEIKSKIKVQKISKMNKNNLTIKIDNLPSINLTFYYKDDQLPLIFERKDIAVTRYEDIISYIHFQYISQNKSFNILPTADIDDTSESQFELELKNNNAALVCKSNDTFWIIVSHSTIGSFFNINFKSKFVIFNILKSVYFERLFNLRGTIQQDTVWVTNSFKYGISMLSDKLCKGINIIPSKTFFIFGNIQSTYMSHINKIIQRNAKITTSIQDANTVLIQESYLRFLHLIPGFYNSLKNFTKFFIIKYGEIEEILPSGGIVTFNDEYIKNAELIEVADLIKSLSKRRNWEVKVKISTYLTLKQRLAVQTTAIEHINNVKLIYKTFKENICESCEDNLREYLEMKYFRTHRHFIEISKIKIDNVAIPIHEAIKLVNAT